MSNFTTTVESTTTPATTGTSVVMTTTFSNATETPGALVPFSVGAVVGMGVAWLVVLCLAGFWCFSMRRKYVATRDKERDDAMQLKENEEAKELVQRSKKVDHGPVVHHTF